MKFINTPSIIFLMDVQYSAQDKKRGIQIPTSLTPELAELIGILVGDGNIYLRKNKKYEIRICGHLSEDKEHHQTIIASLFNKVFNVKNLVETTHPYKCARYTGISSKAITTFLVYNVGLPSGRKLDAKQIIPLAILTADDFYNPDHLLPRGNEKVAKVLAQKIIHD